MTYFLTFPCYGQHLHGELGAVDRHNNRHGAPTLEESGGRLKAERDLMAQPPYDLDEIRREAVLQAITEVCAFREWVLLAAHVRSTHVHAVIRAEASAERVLTDLKAYASRKLNSMNIDSPNRKRWARHGSTRYLWKSHEVTAAVDYVIRQQGREMSAFESEQE